MTTQCESFKIQIDKLTFLETENHRLKMTDQENNRLKQNNIEEQELITRLKEQINKLENDLSRRNVELSTKDEAIAQIDIDVREM